MAMAVDHIRYDILAQEALRGMVRTVLVDAAKNGLPGDHHFFITFNTQAEGVRLSPRMLAQYPEEMTVVLQHQFWDLVVTDEGFEVGLSFGGIPERLTVPFAAIKGFADPSVEFGLRFEDVSETAAAAGQGQQPGKTPQAEGGAAAGKPPERPPREHKSPRAPLAAVPTPAAPEQDQGPADQAATQPGRGEVVRLDRFRKKQE
jgi:hypothetical protein